MLPPGAEDEIARVAQLETGQRAQAVIVVGTVDEIVVALHFETGEGRAGDEVGDARDRIRTVGRTGPVLEQFDPFEREQRHQLGVDETRAGAEDGALAVEQHQSALRPEPAQVERADALEPLCVGGKLVGIAQRCADRGQFLDEFERAVDALFGEVVGGEDIHRQRRVFGRPANIGSGNDDAVFILRRGSGGLDLCLGQGRGCRKRSSGERAQRATVA